MDFLDDIVSRLSAAIAERPAPDKSLKITLKGLGTIVVTNSMAAKQDSPTDTAITISRPDFEKLIAGKLNPQTAYLMGKIKVNGDPMAALQWLPVLQNK
jgi:putative sterol carrier protein